MAVARGIYRACWVFTHHKKDECSECLDFPSEPKEFTCKGIAHQIIGGGYSNEVGGQGKTPHHQGFVVLYKDCTFAAIKSAFCSKIHWEPMNGSIEQSIEYCGKENPLISFGDLTGIVNKHMKSGQGARNDSHEVHQLLQAGKRKGELWESHFEYCMRNHRGIGEYKSVTAKASPVNKVVVYYGVAGSGKTATCTKDIGERSCYEPEENNSGLISFESYDGQEVILLNDFSSKSLNVCALKRILDPYRGAMLPGRGRSVPNQAKEIYITSNYNPRTWYDAEEWPALERRFTSLTYCGANEWTNELTGEKFPNPWKQHLIAQAQVAMGNAVL